MKRLTEWIRQDKRYVILIKAVLLALLPVLCCMIRCALAGGSLEDIWLPGCEWNDELFYYKQVEGIVNYGYPLGYYGFNESHALKLSFAAWSPVLVFPWIIWGLLFGWNLMSPIVCNIVLFSLVCFVFVLLVKPSWRQLGITALLLGLYTPLWRYMLSTMSEVICISMVVLFYAVAIDYFNREKKTELVLLFVLSAVMTLMRPYLVLFMLLPAYAWVKKSKWKGAVGSVALMGCTFALYAVINHYFGAEYFAPLFFTDWLKAFFERGIFGGIYVTCGKLYRMGTSFLAYTVEGFRSGLYAGTYFAAFIIMLIILACQTVADLSANHRAKRQGTDSALSGQFIVRVHLLFSFVAMLVALLLMYKLTEGSRHLLTFLSAGIFLVALMDTKYYKKAVLLGVTFAYFFTYMARDPIVYQLPFQEKEEVQSLKWWENTLEEKLELNRTSVPSYENVIIWVTSDEDAEGKTQSVRWQVLYALPAGFGISCCEKEYCMEQFDSLQSRYMATLSGGELDERCKSAGCVEIGRDKDVVIYDLYSAK